MCGFTEKGRIRCNRIDRSSTERENAYESRKRNKRADWSPPNDDKVSISVSNYSLVGLGLATRWNDPKIITDTTNIYNTETRASSTSREME